jgi:hypothetical protein
MQLLSCSVSPQALLAEILKEFQSCKKSHKPHLALDPDSDYKVGQKNSSLAACMEMPRM